MNTRFFIKLVLVLLVMAFATRATFPATIAQAKSPVDAQNHPVNSPEDPSAKDTNNLTCHQGSTATGQALATVVIVVIGLAALLGKISWGAAITTTMGIVIVYAGATIAASLFCI